MLKSRDSEVMNRRFLTPEEPNSARGPLVETVPRALRGEAIGGPILALLPEEAH